MKKIINQSTTIYLFYQKDYIKNPKKFLIQLKIFLKKEKIIIRSSSLQEDNVNQSFAGKFKSFNNLTVKYEVVTKYVDKIIDDFKNKNDQIIVQEFI